MKTFIYHIPCNCFIFSLLLISACHTPENGATVIDLEGPHTPVSHATWLTHEHTLVDFSGAEKIDPGSWEHEEVIREMMLYFEALKKHQVNYFVDATPNYLGRDVELLSKISEQTGIRILTNTGLYGARDNKFIPAYAFEKSAEELANMWIGEFENGIDGTTIRPGFIKIAVDTRDTLHAMHLKLAKAAALTHLKTGLTIASHTGKANGLWPQLATLEKEAVSPKAFIWVHAQNEENPDNYLRAARAGCWISLDGLGWELEKHIDKLVFARENSILDNILISHDAGWYDPQKDTQFIQPYTAIFEKLYPALLEKGFTDKDWDTLLRVNPVKAFSIDVDTLTYRMYPSLNDQQPDLPSPYLSATGETYVTAVTKDDKYAVIPVTLSNDWDICPQLIVDTLDFPGLAKTGLHPEGSLDRIPTITGRPVEEITRLGRPGGLSQGGFMAEDETILSVLQEDNRIVRQLGLTHPQLAKPLFYVLNMIDTDLSLDRWNMPKHQWDNIHHFFYNGQQVMVTAEDTKGGQQSIFDDQIQGGFFIQLWRELSETEEQYLKQQYAHLAPEAFDELKTKLSHINTGEIQPQYIMRYGFYEGHTYWRADPVALSFIFGLKSLEELDLVVEGSLYDFITGRYKGSM